MPCSKCRWRSGGCGACRAKSLALKKASRSKSDAAASKRRKSWQQTRDCLAAAQHTRDCLTAAQQTALTRTFDAIETPAKLEDDVRYVVVDVHGRARGIDAAMQEMIARRRARYTATGWWSGDDWIATSDGPQWLSFVSTPVGDTLRIVACFHTAHGTWPIVRDVCA